MSSTPRVSSAKRGLGHIPSLDGLRAVSFLVVFLAHAGSEKFMPAHLGLAIFFFLSGYLITTLLRVEYEKTGRISLQQFYLRRVLRIFPPFYLLLAAASVLTWFGVLEGSLRPGAVLAQMLHVSNYYIIRAGWWTGRAPGTWVYWSLAVEEHFYLLFPLFYLFLRRKVRSPRNQMLVLLGLCLVELAWRCVLVFAFHAGKDRTYVATDTRIDSILFGCILAVYGNPALDPTRISGRWWKAFWLPLGGAVLLATCLIRDPRFQESFRYTLESLALFPLFIVAVRYPHWAPCRLLNMRWLRFVGTLSYSLYLMHTTVLYLLHQWVPGNAVVQDVLALVMSLLIAALIYQLVEKPCARLRKRLSGSGMEARPRSESPQSPHPLWAQLAGATRHLHRPHGRTEVKLHSLDEAHTPGSHRSAVSSLVARNVLVTVATQIVSWVLTFIVTLYLPRYIGAAGLGKLAFATSFVAILGVLVPLGTRDVLVKEIARERSRTGELLLAAGALRILLGIAVVALVTVITYLLGYPELMRLLVGLTAVGMVVSTVNDALAAALQGQERLSRQSLALIVEKCLTSSLTLFLVFHRAPLWTLAAVGGFTSLFSILINLSALRGFCPALRWPRLATMHYLIVAGTPYIGWTIFRTLYGQCDPVVLSLITNDATVGWYAAATRLIGSTYFLPTALATALFPTLARLYRDDVTEFQHLVRRLFALNMLCAVPIALILIFVPDRLLALLHYPAEFAHSICVLRVGGVGVVLNFIGCVLGATIITSDRQDKMVRVSFLACVLGIPACILGSYVTHQLWGNGALGAMISDVALEFYLVCTYLRIVPDQVFDRANLSLMLRCLLASVPMGVWLALAPSCGLGLWALIPCLPLYAGSCWLMRCLSPEHLALLRSAVPKPVAH